MTQYHFLDDSGDPGLRDCKGSSSHFALAMVQLTNHEPIIELDAVRQKFHLPPSFEFKFSKTDAAQKDEFFAVISALPFRIRALVIDKSTLGNQFLLLNGQDFSVEWITALTMRASPLDISNDILILDGTTPDFQRELRINFSKMCRRTNRSRPFKKIIRGDSQSDDGLQLADMLVGAIKAKYIKGDNRFFERIEHKIVDLWQIMR